MLLRAILFALIGAPVWLIYVDMSSSSERQPDRPLPAESAIAWTAVDGVACFAAPLVRRWSRMVHASTGRRVRVRRVRTRAGRVPTLRLAAVSAARPIAAGSVVVDPTLWARIQRIESGPIAATSFCAGGVDRRSRRRSVVRFFDGRVTFCGVAGAASENPSLRVHDDDAATPLA